MRTGGGGSTLTLALYPFYYDPTAQYSEYYQQYDFDVETVSTTVGIDASTSKTQYSPGEEVVLSLSLENTGAPFDAVVGAVIKSIGSGEPVDGFTLTGLTGFEGTTVLDLTWNWADLVGIPAGDYLIEVYVEDMGGTRYAQRHVDLHLGTTSGEMTTFSVSPTVFQPGDPIDIGMTFTNTGSLPLDGEMVIQVQTLEGAIIREYPLSIADLASGASLPFGVQWDSTGATSQDYRVVGFVRYDSQTTPAVLELITTNGTSLGNEIFLPLIIR